MESVNEGTEVDSFDQNSSLVENFNGKYIEEKKLRFLSLI